MFNCLTRSRSLVEISRVMEVGNVSGEVIETPVKAQQTYESRRVAVAHRSGAVPVHELRPKLAASLI